MGKVVEALESTHLIDREKDIFEPRPVIVMPLIKVKEELAEPMPLDDIERQASMLEQHLINRQRLKEQLLEEVEAAKLKEASLPALVPSPEDHAGAGHTQVERLARVSGVVNFRQAVQFEDDNLEQPEKTYYGIPKLKRRPPTTITKPYQPKSFGQNTIRTR